MVEGLELMLSRREGNMYSICVCIYVFKSKIINSKIQTTLTSRGYGDEIEEKT